MPLFAEIVAYIAAVILLTAIAKAICETACGILRICFGAACLTLSKVMDTLTRPDGTTFGSFRRSNSIEKSHFEMKTSLSDRVAAAADNARKLGQGAFKNPVSSILSLCLVAGVAATLITFSQESQTPAVEKAAATALPLPADNVELVDVNGRAITVTVLSMATDKLSIIVRTADGKEMPILMSRLNAATIEKLTGEATAPKTAPRILSTKQLNNRAKEASAVREQLRKLPAAEIHKMFVDQKTNKNPEIDLLLQVMESRWGNTRRFQEAKDPAWSNYNFGYQDIMHLIEVKPDDVEEKVSLRSEFERLGVKPTEQERHMCTMYSAQHLAQYVFLKKGAEPPSIENLKTRIRPMWDWTKTGMSTPSRIIIPAIESGNKRLKVLWINGPLPKISDEMIKHQIRNGHPCRVSIWEKIGGGGGSHAIVVIGFHSKDGVTTWEMLNSNNTNEDGGYTTRPNNSIQHDASQDFSAWFE